MLALLAAATVTVVDAVAEVGEADAAVVLLQPADLLIIHLSNNSHKNETAPSPLDRGCFA